MNDKELIEEARSSFKATNASASMIRRLADALEDATRVPVQGEPNDDREALASIIDRVDDKDWGNIFPQERDEIVEEILATGFSRTTVPDVATCETCDRPTAFCAHCIAEREPDAATEELRADKMTAEEILESVLKRPGMYGLVPKNEHRSMKAERDAAVARAERLEAQERYDTTKYKDWKREHKPLTASKVKAWAEEARKHVYAGSGWIAHEDYRRAVVPSNLIPVLERAERAEAERDAALAAVERVRAIHQKKEADAVTGDCATESCEHEDKCPTQAFEVCIACWNLCEEADPYFGERGIGMVLWPCPTVAALDGAPEPEGLPVEGESE